MFLSEHLVSNVLSEHLVVNVLSEHLVSNVFLNISRRSCIHFVLVLFLYL